MRGDTYLAKVSYKKLSWNILYYDINSDAIKSYDVLKYREPLIRKFKKQSQTKEEFSDKLRIEFRWAMQCKAEWELIVEVDEHNHVLLSPFVGSRRPELVRVDVTDDKTFDWHGFAIKHVRVLKNYDNLCEKIDAYDQLEHVWDSFVDYCWYNRLKYERKNPKFDN